MTDVSDLIAWLRQQLHDDEQWARDALAPSQPIDRRIVGVSEAVVAGLARRMLIEVEAKRLILDDYERYAAERRRAMNGWDPELRNPSPIVRFLALPYADREGYREEWKP